MATDAAKKLSVSMPASLYAAMKRRMQELRISKDSAYIQALVDRDTVKRGKLERDTTPLVEKAVSVIKRRRAVN